jgi:hypothetical protein
LSLLKTAELLCEAAMAVSCFIDPFEKIYGEIPWFTPPYTEEVLCVKKRKVSTQNAGGFVNSPSFFF